MTFEWVCSCCDADLTNTHPLLAGYWTDSAISASHLFWIARVHMTARQDGRNTQLAADDWRGFSSPSGRRAADTKGCNRRSGASSPSWNTSRDSSLSFSAIYRRGLRRWRHRVHETPQLRCASHRHSRPPPSLLGLAPRVLQPVPHAPLQEDSDQHTVHTLNTASPPPLHLNLKWTLSLFHHLCLPLHVCVLPVSALSGHTSFQTFYCYAWTLWTWKCYGNFQVRRVDRSTSVVRNLTHETWYSFVFAFNF